ncbi:MAG TPA: hypothetical protein VHX39_20785 [Acetobacteraceae bacterium]|nr:hypothetical protein [Acetobacteraceae bacterium]
MSLLQPVSLIVKAIEEVRMIRLMYQGRQRMLEPHDHGISQRLGPVNWLADCWLQRPPDLQLATDENGRNL